eukprot:TRINITY_DN23699_c0_g1_i1.p2 TRINITY_DN23699_c0_g1~~TRINITY_DN23699_c0_g1_i1.p2  ORF type:complete len:112 (-),score=1.27 TRINITY_DN23699_c0_g1_i1:300-635(-)
MCVMCLEQLVPGYMYVSCVLGCIISDVWRNDVHRLCVMLKCVLSIVGKFCVWRLFAGDALRRERFDTSYAQGPTQPHNKDVCSVIVVSEEVRDRCHRALCGKRTIHKQRER